LRESGGLFSALFVSFNAPGDVACNVSTTGAIASIPVVIGKYQLAGRVFLLVENALFLQSVRRGGLTFKAPTYQVTEPFIKYYIVQI
jgi:hypothetical protein